MTLFLFWKPRRHRRRRRTRIVEVKAKLNFEDGQVLEALGKSFNIRIRQEGIRSRASVKDGVLSIRLASGLDGREKKRHTVNLARRALTKALLPEVEKRVRDLNDVHFKSEIKRVRLKDTATLWGSCSIQNNINLDFRLLFAPPHILDAIIVHELAHTVRRDHSKAFWGLVTNAIPDYKQRRKWLRENAHTLKPTKTHVPEQLNIMESTSVKEEVVQDATQTYGGTGPEGDMDKAGRAELT